MTTRMLIDARHREETRVAVIKGNRIEEFDFESAEHKQLKGNIYLAKVTRVEPSLQAAFIEYGGNRHGFLAFSEIHPDYYQIPKEDRDALLREEAEHAAAEAAMRADEDLDTLDGEIDEMAAPASLGEDDDEHDDEGAEDGSDDSDEDGDDAGRDAESGRDEEGGANGDGRGRRDRNGRRGRGRGRPGGGGRERSDRDDNGAADFRRSLHRRYKIQDVIKRRQVMLVQVVKEERGTKGAALTTYLSLAGRYCVLMPNSSHGGGISRKISNGADRKRLKSVIDELNLPPSMGCIVRTAGLERTKTEIKRDFDYLARLWDEIREKTLSSAAPALIHSDSDLIKRAIRDIYNSDIEDVSVEGEEGYRAAKDFMKLLMPSHARRVKQYSDPVSLFQRYGVEDQLGAMYQPVVGLKSGGYLVINPTEALVSIDINSGRSTREHNIEQTALNTNLEAAYEIARQLRLRDMAGLVVIDFIDMEMGSNVRKVERAMKDALKNDRARIQVGRISGFGLMEMSRQRLRTGVLEASTRACPHCEGTGLVRTASSAGLSALRMLEEEAARGRGSRLVLRASQEAAFYVLNNKRREIGEIETRYGVGIEVQSDGQMEGARMSVEASGPPPANRPRYETIIDEDDANLPDIEEEDAGEEEERAADRGPRGDGDRKRRRNRRRRGRRDGEERSEGAPRAASDTDEGEEGDGAADAESEAADADSDRAEAQPRSGDEGEGGRRRRRGRRGGRNRRSGVSEDAAQDMVREQGEGEASDSDDDSAVAEVEPVAAEPVAEVSKVEAKPSRRRKVSAKHDATPAPAEAEAPAEDAKPKRKRSKKADAAEAPEAAEPAAADGEAVVEPAAEAPPAKPKRASRARKAAAEPELVDTIGSDSAVAADGADLPDTAEPAMADASAVEVPASEPAESAPRKSGWWQRTFGA
jgi:ribonuclease E